MVYLPSILCGLGYARLSFLKVLLESAGGSQVSLHVVEDKYFTYLEDYFWRQTVYNAPLTMICSRVERHNLRCCVS